MARGLQFKCVRPDLVKEISTATSLLELFESVNTNRGKIRQHEGLSNAQGGQVRLLYQCSDHLAYLMVREHEVVSIWPVMSDGGIFEGNNMRPLKALTVSANPTERPTNKQPGQSPVHVQSITDLELTENLVETLNSPNGIGHFIFTQYGHVGPGEWTMSLGQHCHNVFRLFKRVHSSGNNLPARVEAIQVFHDYVVAMSFRRIRKRKQYLFDDRNFGDILKMTLGQLEAQYASSSLTFTHDYASIDDIPYFRGGSPEKRTHILSDKERTIADPEQLKLLEEISNLGSAPTWETSSLNPTNVVGRPNELGGESVVYNQQGRRDFHDVCRALFEGIERSVDALNHAIQQGRLEESPDVRAQNVFQAVRRFQTRLPLLAKDMLLHLPARKDIPL
ncbi:hypothetical protein K4K49_002950 [Colletotrichum sp. SAR 10_70]|nr:hypothetical protein K4K50_008329 [Colletotrichum sp. SAR 10_71]KAI8174190.1 hypothetical protein K4K49_002950 [Colletotrichum sp. SAR 10_70]